ncbi:MAG: hypothetical protein EAX95_07145 [Candidatus Thorarchaeota archaeon]|nr:hypothetical protein [Candidatus Thorarchaeota archaeon]
MREASLILTTSTPEKEPSSSSLSRTPSESLWDTTKDEGLHVLLREPALLELARRKEPGVDIFCERLVNCGDPECWFTAVKALTVLNTYDAVNRLLAIAGSSSPQDRRIVICSVARILTSAQREQFRRLVGFFANPGLLDVTGWTSVAVRMLAAVCEEKGLKIIPHGPFLLDAPPQEPSEVVTSFEKNVHSLTSKE